MFKKKNVGIGRSFAETRKHGGTQAGMYGWMHAGTRAGTS